MADYWQQFAKQQQLLTNTYDSTDQDLNHTLEGNPNSDVTCQLTQQLQQLNLIDNNHIPQSFLINSTQKRLDLLAGLIDSCGQCLVQASAYKISLTNENLAQQIKFLCDSLGFRTILNETSINIYGAISSIPTKITKHTASPWEATIDWQATDITVVEDVVDNYYGFTLDKNNLFLLEDMTVTHNTSFTMAVARNAAIDFNKGVAFFSLEMSSCN